MTQKTDGQIFGDRDREKIVGKVTNRNKKQCKNQNDTKLEVEYKIVVVVVFVCVNDYWYVGYTVCLFDLFRDITIIHNVVMKINIQMHRH